MWHNLFPYTALTPSLPTLIYSTNSPLLKSKKLDFQLLLPCPIPCPLPDADPTSRPPLPPLWPPSTLGRRGPCWSYGWGLISSAHLETGWGRTGVHKGQGLDLLAVSSIVTQRRGQICFSIVSGAVRHQIDSICSNNSELVKLNLFNYSLSRQTPRSQEAFHSSHKSHI